MLIAVKKRLQGSEFVTFFFIDFFFLVIFEQKGLDLCVEGWNLDFFCGFYLWMKSGVERWTKQLKGLQMHIGVFEFNLHWWVFYLHFYLFVNFSDLVSFFQYSYGNFWQRSNFWYLGCFEFVFLGFDYHDIPAESVTFLLKFS